jgi:hypothetical protein
MWFEEVTHCIFYEQPEINGYILVRYEVMKPWRNILMKIENILNILDKFS